MKTIYKIIVAAGIALIAGLGIGYLLFNTPHNSEAKTAAPAGSMAAVEYTCSMHPQIRQMEPGICPLCEMDLTPLEASSGNEEITLTMSPEAVKLADIQTTRVGVGGQGGKRVHLSGKIIPDERRVLAQTAHVAGRIERLYVTYTGEAVRAGQPLARLYAPALVNAQREFLEALRLKNSSPQVVEAARNRLRSWKLPESFIETLEKDGKIQREVEIKADRSGVVVSRKVAVGDYVEEGGPLFELIDLKKVWALLEAYESDLPSIQIGSRVDITTPAVPGQTFSARIVFIDPLLNSESRTVGLRVELDNPNGVFKPGMFVEGEVLGAARKKNTLVVPKTAVLWTGKRSVVYVRVPNAAVPTFEFREVELGESTEMGIQIHSGLEPGEEVVTQGAFAIDAAAQLNNQSSMINRRVRQQGSEQVSIPDLKGLVDPAFASRWQKTVQAYLELKDALVKTQPKTAGEAAGRLLSAVNAVAVDQLDPTLQNWWLQRAGGLKAHARKLSLSDDVNEQRRQFLFISELMIQHIQALGSGSDALFIQFCPMAFNNQGGDWISAQREVLNPYFGDEMLRCGVVKDSFP